MQEHGAVLAEALGCVPSDSAVKDAGQDSSRWLVIDPLLQEFRDCVVRMATTPPGFVWAPNRKFPTPESLELYDSLDRYDWAGAEVWEKLHDNPTAYRAIRVVPTGETAGGVSQYAVVEDRLLRDWMIDIANPQYARMHEVACLHGWWAYNPNVVGAYGSGEYRNAGRESTDAVKVLRDVGGFNWLCHHLECMGTTNPYLALAVRPHIGQGIDQQCYDGLRRGFEAQRGELLHPDDQPLAGISYPDRPASAQRVVR